MNAVTLSERRAAATDAFAANSLPGRRVENWKYTDLKSHLSIDAVRDAAAAVWNIDALPVGVELVDLSTPNVPAWVEHHFGVLGTRSVLAEASLGFAQSGFALRVATGVRAGTIRVRISGAGALRALVLVEADACLHVEEVAEAGYDGLRNVGIEFLACPGAEIAHWRLGQHAPAAVSYESVEVLLHGGARFKGHYAGFGAKAARLDFHAVMAEPDAVVDLSGVTVLGGTDHTDITTHIEHKAAGRSNQLFKYIAGGKARGVYQGRISVQKGADGTDSRQTARAILVSERAEADLKPELEIFADDVKCAHGAAIGDLDADAMFYLRSRGLCETEARDMLIRAFLGEAVDGIESDPVREEIWQAVEAALPRAMENVA